MLSLYFGVLKSMECSTISSSEKGIVSSVVCPHNKEHGNNKIRKKKSFLIIKIPETLINHCTNTAVGKHFDKQGMWDTAIYNVCTWNAAGQGYFAAVDFWEHAAGEDAGCF